MNSSCRDITLAVQRRLFKCVGHYLRKTGGTSRRNNGKLIYGFYFHLKLPFTPGGSHATETLFQELNSAWRNKPDSRHATNFLVVGSGRAHDRSSDRLCPAESKSKGAGQRAV